MLSFRISFGRTKVLLSPRPNILHSNTMCKGGLERNLGRELKIEEEDLGIVVRV